MASSWPSDSPDAIGDDPYHMGAWDKMVLGWSDLATVRIPAEEDTVKLGPAEGSSTAGAQALARRSAQLPPGRHRVPIRRAPTRTTTTRVRATYIETTMRRSLGWRARCRHDPDVPCQLRHRADWDYAYVEYSDDDGATWQSPGRQPVDLDRTRTARTRASGITGTSGAWVDGTYTLPAGATDIGFRYWTDGAVAQKGFAVDSIQVGTVIRSTTRPIRRRGPSTGSRNSTDGTYQVDQFHYYLIESRSHIRQDDEPVRCLPVPVRQLAREVVQRRRAVGVVSRQRLPGQQRLGAPRPRRRPGRRQPSRRRVVQPGTGGEFWRERIQAWDATVRRRCERDHDPHGRRTTKAASR